MHASLKDYEKKGKKKLLNIFTSSKQNTRHSQRQHELTVIFNLQLGLLWQLYSIKSFHTTEQDFLWGGGEPAPTGEGYFCKKF